MTDLSTRRGAAPVGFITELPAIEAASVLYLRLWSDGPDQQSEVMKDFQAALGLKKGVKAVATLEQLFSLCARFGRRPLMRHSVDCKCLGADESCFANFIAAAVDGDREDALLMATLLVRPDVAPQIAALASEFGLALKSMRLVAPSETAAPTFTNTTLH
ncbi:MAG: hypothetical protein ACJAVM_002302 [Sulfitobacter sp.]|jgi:hypothetical protein